MKVVGCRDYCNSSTKLHIFYTPLVFLGIEFAITENYDLGWLRDAGRQDTDVHVSSHVPISTFITRCDHNPPTLQTDGRTDGRHARSISATCEYRPTACRVVLKIENECW